MTRLNFNMTETNKNNVFSDKTQQSPPTGKSTKTTYCISYIVYGVVPAYYLKHKLCLHLYNYNY